MTNSQTMAETRQALGIEQLQEAIPRATPVVEVNPKAILECNHAIGGTATTSTDLYTTPTTKDYYLNVLTLSIAKAVGDANASVTAKVTPWGTATAVDIAGIAGLTLTASQDTVVISIPKPGLKHDPGTSIRVAYTNTGGKTFIGVVGTIVERNGSI